MVNEVASFKTKKNYNIHIYAWYCYEASEQTHNEDKIIGHYFERLLYTCKLQTTFDFGFKRRGSSGFGFSDNTICNQFFTTSVCIIIHDYYIFLFNNYLLFINSRLVKM